MAFEQQIRDLIREELEAALEPLAREVAELQRDSDLSARLRAALGGALPQAAARRKGRAKAGKASKASVKSHYAFAVIGCRRPQRSKGYCAAHYQKRRNLEKTKRLPPDWVEDAKPHSVTDIVLPRGRRAATPR